MLSQQLRKRAISKTSGHNHGDGRPIFRVLFAKGGAVKIGGTSFSSVGIMVWCIDSSVLPRNTLARVGKLGAC